MRTLKHSLLGLVTLASLAACSTGNQLTGDVFVIEPKQVDTGVGCTFSFTVKGDSNPANVTFKSKQDPSGNPQIVVMTGAQGTAKAVGSVAIEATSSDGKKTALATVNVINGKACPGPGGDPISIQIVRGDNGNDPGDPFKFNKDANFPFKVVVTGGPAGSSRKATWKITNGGAVSLVSPDLVTATIDAIVKGVATGTATLVATSEADPSKTDSVNIEVVLTGGNGDKPFIIVKPNPLNLNVNGTGNLVAEVYNSSSDVTWETPNGGIVSLAPVDGKTVKVTGLTKGTATVTAKLVSDNTITGSALVNVDVGAGGTGIEIPKSCTDFSNKPCGNIPTGHVFPDPCTDGGSYLLTQAMTGKAEDILYVKCTVPVQMNYPAGTTRIELWKSQTNNIPSGPNMDDVSFSPAKTTAGVHVFNWDTRNCEQGIYTYLVMRIWVGTQPQLPKFIKVVCDNYGPTAFDLRQPYTVKNNNTVPATFIVAKPVTLQGENPNGVEDLPSVTNPGSAGVSRVYYFIQPVVGSPKGHFDRATAKLVCVAPASSYECQLDPKNYTNGKYELVSVVTDLIWNLREGTATKLITIANDGPTITNFKVTADNPYTRTDLQVISGVIRVLANAVDADSGIASITLTIDGRNIPLVLTDAATGAVMTPCQRTPVVARTGVGGYDTNAISDRRDGEFKLVVENCAGIKTASATQFWTVDNTAPEGHFVTPSVGSQCKGGDPLQISLSFSEKDPSVASGLQFAKSYYSISQTFSTGTPSMMQWFQIPEANNTSAGDEMAYWYPVTTGTGGKSSLGPVSGTYGIDFICVFNNDYPDQIHPDGYGGARGLMGLGGYIVDLGGNGAFVSGKNMKYGGGPGDAWYVRVAPNFDAATYELSQPFIFDVAYWNETKQRPVCCGPLNGVAAGDMVSGEAKVFDKPNFGAFNLYDVIFYERTVVTGALNFFNVVDHPKTTTEKFTTLIPKAPYNLYDFLVMAIDKGGTPNWAHNNVFPLPPLLP